MQIFFFFYKNKITSNAGLQTPCTSMRNVNLDRDTSHNHGKGCGSVYEEKSEKVLNNLKCQKRCAFRCMKSLKMGFCEEQNSLKTD